MRGHVHMTSPVGGKGVPQKADKNTDKLLECDVALRGMGGIGQFCVLNMYMPPEEAGTVITFANLLSLEEGSRHFLSAFRQRVRENCQKGLIRNKYCFCFSSDHLRKSKNRDQKYPIVDDPVCVCWPDQPQP